MSTPTQANQAPIGDPGKLRHVEAGSVQEFLTTPEAKRWADALEVLDKGADLVVREWDDCLIVFPVSRAAIERFGGDDPVRIHKTVKAVKDTIDVAHPLTVAREV